MDQDRMQYVDILGKQYPLCFTISAQEQVNKEFGGLSKMFDAIKGDADAAPSAVTDLLHILMVGGAARVKALAWMEGETPDLPKLPPREVLKELVTMGDVAALKENVFFAIRRSMERTVEVAPESPKNAETTQG